MQLIKIIREPSHDVRSVELNNKMTMNLCKPPDPVLFTGNNGQNWKDFEEQLHWFLAGTEQQVSP